MTRSPKHPAAGGPDELPGDLASAQETILALRALLTEKDAALIAAQSEAKVRALEIERLKLQLAKARHEVYGQSSERAKLLVEQLELAIEDLEEAQAEEETRAEMAAMEASAYGFSLTRHPTDQFAQLVDNVRVHTLAAAGKASKTVSTEALAVFAQIEEQDSRIAVVLDDGQTTLRAVMKGGLLPPPPTRDGPGVYVVRIGAQRTILEWTPAAAYSARKLARAKAKVA